MNTHDLLDHLTTGAKHFLDVFSYSIALGVVVQILPPLAAALSVVWLGLQMFAYFRRKAWRTDQEIKDAAGLDEMDKR
jgi:hypothetical protein